MAKRVWKSEETGFRYLVAVIILLICLTVEYQMLDRLMQQAYQVRYQEHLETFRKEPLAYLHQTIGKEAYDVFFQEQVDGILTDIRSFPIEKSYIQDISYEDSWYGERNFGGDRKHEGTDLMSGSNISGAIPVVSMTDGVVTNIGWLYLGGWRIGIQSEQGIYYYYAHLHSYAADIRQGDTVHAGQLLGFMGNSGYGEEGTVGMFDVHLHVGIYIYDDSGREISLNPYPFLKEFQEKDIL